MIKEHQVNVLQLSGRVKSLDRGIAGADDNLDDITEPGKIDERCDYSAEFWVSFQAEVALATSFADGISKQNAGVANVAT